MSILTAVSSHHSAWDDAIVQKPTRAGEVWSTLAQFAIGVSAQALPKGFFPRAIATRLAYGTVMGACIGTAFALSHPKDGRAFLREVALGAFSGAMALGLLERGIEEIFGKMSTSIVCAMLSGATGGFAAAIGTSYLEGCSSQEILQSGLGGAAIGAVLGAGCSAAVARLSHRRTIPAWSSSGVPVDPRPPTHGAPDASDVKAIHRLWDPQGRYHLEHPSITQGILIGFDLRSPLPGLTKGFFGEGAFVVSKIGYGLTPPRPLHMGDAFVTAEITGPTAGSTRQVRAVADGMGAFGAGYDAHAAQAVSLSFVQGAIESRHLSQLADRAAPIENALVNRATHVSTLPQTPPHRGMGSTLVYHANDIDSVSWEGETRDVLITISGAAGDSHVMRFFYDKKNTKLTRLFNHSPDHSRNHNGEVRGAFVAIPSPSGFIALTAKIQPSMVQRFLLPRPHEVGTAKVIQLLASDGLEKALPYPEILAHLTQGLQNGRSITAIHQSLAKKAQIIPELCRCLAHLQVSTQHVQPTHPIHKAILRKALNPFLKADWLSTELKRFKTETETILSNPSIPVVQKLERIEALFGHAELGERDDLTLYLGSIDVEKEIL